MQKNSSVGKGIQIRRVAQVLYQKGKFRHPAQAVWAVRKKTWGKKQ